MIWWKTQLFKMVWKICSWLAGSISNLKRNDQKQFRKKLLTAFFVSREERKLKERSFIGAFAVFKLIAVMSIAKLFYVWQYVFRYLQLSRCVNSYP